MVALQDEDGGEWIPASEAAMLAAKRFGGLTVAKHALAVGLREGMLSASAEGCQIFDADADQAEEHESTLDQLLDVPIEVFSQSTSWESDRLGWDWDIGGFDVDTDEASYAFIGVYFLKSEVDAIDPSAAPYRALTVDKPKEPQAEMAPREPRPRVRYWDWERALAELVSKAHFDGLEEFGDLAKRGNQKKLEAWFEDWFENDSQSRASGSSREAPSVGERRKRAQFVAAAIRSRGMPGGDI